MAGESATSGNLVIDWNETLLSITRLGPPRPTVISRALDVVHTAMYDAWTAYDSTASSAHIDLQRPEVEHTAENIAEAISFAAYRTALTLFTLPTQQAALTQFMQSLGYDVLDTGTDPTTASGIGNLASAAVVASRAGDGSNQANNYVDTTGYVPVNSADPAASNAPGGVDFDPNRWQPLRVPTGAVLDAEGNPIVTADPASFTDQKYLTPHWGQVTPFALEAGDQYRPQAPPQKGDFSPYVDATGQLTTNDAAWHEQIDEVLQISADLTPEHKAIAEFWADGPRSETPPGHWNQLAQGIALRDDLDVGETVKLFFALNNALLDAAITAWEAKKAYDSIRPVSAIRDEYFGQQIEAWGGPNQGTQTILGQDWQPYQTATFVTPPFPEFMSGHSTFSAAAATVLEQFSRTARFFDGTTLIDEDLDHDGELDLLGQFKAQGLAFETYVGPPIVLQWETLFDAAAEAGISRLYGGIHIEDGDLFARLAGRAVGEQAFAMSELLFAGVEVDLKVDGSQTADELRGKAGLDVVLGFAGDDQLSGFGDDVVQGGTGNDSLFGGLGNDELRGGEGDDLMLGDLGQDELFGGEGNDTLDGGLDVDQLFGGAGDDVLTGGDGDDQLRGGEGNDIMDGGTGDDMLLGGAGDNLFVFQAGGGADTVKGFTIGHDLIDASAFGLSAAQLLAQVEQQGNTCVIVFDEATGVQASLVGVKFADLSENVFVV